MNKENIANPPTQKKPSLGIALLPLIIMGLLLGVGYGVYKIRPQVLLVCAAFLTGCLGFLLKFSWKDMERGIVDSIHRAMPAILIMLTVGILKSERTAKKKESLDDLLLKEKKKKEGFATKFEATAELEKQKHQKAKEKFEKAFGKLEDSEER